MDLFLVAKIIGAALSIEAGLMLVPLLFAVLCRESIKVFLIPIAICYVAGTLLMHLTEKDNKLRSKEGIVATALTWIAMSLAGMLPFLLGGVFASPVDAFFETVSGFTTTGSTVLTDVESVPRSILLWRSFTHWIGGMGILVFMSAIIKFKGGSQMKLMKAESPGPVVSKLVPKAGDTARLLYIIYTGLTAATLIVLLLLRMPVFDAICITFGAAGTGGFGVLNSSCAEYTAAQQTAITIAMLVFGVNFNFYFLLMMRKAGQALRMEEVRLYIVIAVSAAVIITADLMHAGLSDTVHGALHNAAFHVSSIMTSTGYAIDDINNWPHLSQTVILILMLCGACAGSTGGGYKVSRVLLMGKAFARDISVQLRPDMVRKVHIDGKPVEEELIRTTGVYTFIYIIIIGISVLLLMFDGRDGMSTVTAVISTFNNIGPGIGFNGSMGNYADFSAAGKLLLSADMLIGRLEIFPILGLLSRDTWRKF